MSSTGRWPAAETSRPAWGLILDPGADKLMTVLTILFLSFYYPYPLLPLLMIIADLMILFANSLAFVFLKALTPPPANRLGKSKMLFGVLAIILMYFVLIFRTAWLLLAADAAIIAAMVLGFAFFAVYGLEFINRYSSAGKN